MSVPGCISIFLALLALEACRGDVSTPRVHAGQTSADAAAPTGPPAGINIASLTSDMVRVPGGSFSVYESTFALALPEFYIDRTEVTVAAYRKCVDVGRCSAPVIGDHCDEKNFEWDKPGRADYPINCVDERQAGQYCAFRGKRLPRAGEWIRAAAGTDGRPFPWGTTSPTCDLAVYFDLSKGKGCGSDGPRAVGSLPGGASQDGALDLVGNVEEWVSNPATTYKEHLYAPYERIMDWKNPDAFYGTIGGGYDHVLEPDDLSEPYATDRAADSVGFRCAVSFPSTDPATAAPPR